MIYYLNKEVIKTLKRSFPIREIKYHDFSFMSIGPGCPYNGVVIKEIKKKMKRIIKWLKKMSKTIRDAIDYYMKGN